MPKEMYLNIPVKDLQRSIDFYTALGFSFNQQFTDEKAACMIVESNIYIMLLKEEFFKTFTNKDIANPHQTTGALIGISADSKDAVDTLVNKAKEAGGSSPMPQQDHGWMYGHGFTDLDGHMWEILYMDPAGPPQQ